MIALTTLLATKLYLPPARPNRVSRPHLMSRLDEGLTRPLTLISAPAGFGKTTLIGDWRTVGMGRDIPLAWLSLDENDDEPARFLTYVIAALGTFSPALGQDAQSLLRSTPPPPIETILTELINDLTSLPAPFAVVLDDYHFITSPTIHSAIAFLLAHMPARMHLFILTRADPPLPLARLRASDQLVEIRASDLRFGPDEAAAFLNRVMGLNLTLHDIAALERRTEGWIVGLQLAALALQKPGEASAFIAAFTGSNQYLVDYLVEEVLNRQPEPVQTFLFDTSVLERLNGPLCDALTGRSDGQSTLQALERANLFVTPLDQDRRWYRYHQLFLEMLCNRLQSSSPDHWRELHRRAAGWFERNGFVAEAISHSLDAADRESAAVLVEQSAMTMLMRGEVVTLKDWIRSVGQLPVKRPWLSIYEAWTLILTGQLEPAGQLLHEAEQILPVDDGDTRHMQGHIAAIQAYLAVSAGNVRDAAELANQALQLLPDSDASTRSFVTYTLGGVCWVSGDVPGAIRAFGNAGFLAKVAGNIHLAVSAMSSHAGLLMEQGPLHKAEQVLQEAVQLATSTGGRPLPIAAIALNGLARVSYERDDLDAAAIYASQATELGRLWGRPDTVTASYQTEVFVRQAQGKPKEALAVLRESRQYAQEQGLMSIVSNLDTCQARLWLAQGNVTGASDWAQQSRLSVDDDVPYSREGEYLVFIRLLLAQNAVSQALTFIERLIRQRAESRRGGHAIELDVLKSLALYVNGDIDPALAELRLLLSLTEPEGYTRMFVDAGESMADLLRHAGSAGIAPNEVSRLLAAFARHAGADSPAPQPLIEPLSARELEVLRLVADGFSNEEIAARLFVTVGTVKTHTSNIYHKVGVSSRTQAVARAKALGIL